MSRKRWMQHRPLFATPVPKEVRQPKIRWRILPILWRAVKGTCLVIGAFVLISALIGAFVSSTLTPGQPASLPDKLVLYLPLEESLSEMPPPPNFVDPFAPQPPTVHALVNAIDRAAADSRVKGIFARMNEGNFALARSQELRAAIKRFRATGKFAHIYATSYAAGGGDLGRYYLAAAFGEIWMQPMGLVSIVGVRAEVPFVRNILDKIGISPQFFQRKEYKSLYESFLRDDMSPASREETERLIADIRAAMMKDLPADRGLTPAAFNALMNKGLFTAPEALAAKLITRADYGDVLLERVKKDVTGDPQAEDSLFVDAADYLHAVQWEDTEKNLMKGSFSPHKPSVALVYVVGAIVETDPGGGGAFVDDGIAAADEIAPAIHDAAEDDAIKAIVLRVDSPGGSPAASESILHAIQKARAKGKPVIVSMGTAAASGGYWVSAYADRIFALPTTITGSIGVAGGKVSAEEMWKNIGVHWDKSIQWGQNAGIWSLNTPFSESEAERVNAMMDHVYASFVDRVAKGRKLTSEQVEQIARGRVWTGLAASKIGLVDEEGGLREAMDYTARLVGAVDRNGIDIKVMPEPKTPFEELLEMLEEQGGSVRENMWFQQRIASFFRPVMQGMAVYRDSQGVTAYEPLRIE